MQKTTRSLVVLIAVTACAFIIGFYGSIFSNIFGISNEIIRPILIVCVILMSSFFMMNKTPPAHTSHSDSGEDTVTMTEGSPAHTVHSYSGKDAAIQNAKDGAIAAYIQSGMTLAAGIYAISSNVDGALKYQNDPLIFFTVFLMFICGYGMHKNSRAAAVIISAHFIYDKALLFLMAGENFEIGTASSFGQVISLIFLYFYVMAIKGTFAYHRIEKASNPEYKPVSKWVFIFGIPMGVLVLALLTLGVLEKSGILPTAKVISGYEIRASDREFLITSKIVEDGENIEYFNPNGLFSSIDQGEILTDHRVISYLKGNNGKLIVYELYFNEISSVELIEAGDEFSPSVYKVKTSEEDKWIELHLPKESGGDLKFIGLLRQKLDHY
jgi:hypothetical protein